MWSVMETNRTKYHLATGLYNRAWFLGLNISPRRFVSDHMVRGDWDTSPKSIDHEDLEKAIQELSKQDTC